MNILTKVGQQDNIVTYEHVCDTKADMANIEKRYITLGTVCIVLTGESEGLEVYMADSKKEWHDLVAGVSGSGAGAGGGLEIHLCAQSEVGNDGLPDIEYPLDTVLYLVPSGEDSENLYNEYIYVNGEWEPFGSGKGGIDWNQAYKEVINQTIIIDEEVDESQLDVYADDNENTIYYNYRLSYGPGEFSFNIENAEEIYVSIDNGAFIMLPKTNTISDVITTSYLFGEIDNEEMPSFTTYPVMVAFTKANNPRALPFDTVVIFNTPQSPQHITVKTKTTEIVINENFQTAVNYATANNIKYGGTISSTTILEQDGIRKEEAPGAITLYIEPSETQLIPILRDSNDETIYAIGEETEDQSYMKYIFYNLKNDTYILNFANSETFNITPVGISGNGENDLLAYDIIINNESLVFIITKSNWDGDYV